MILVDYQNLEQLHTDVYRYCLSLTETSWDAEDLAQDTWLKAINTLNSLGHVNPKAFLLRIAKNTWIDQTRRRTTFERILKQERLNGTMTDHSSFEIEMALKALMKHLPSLQRTVFLLRDVCGYTISEVAEILNKTKGSIKAALHRARHSLTAVREDLVNDEIYFTEDKDEKAFLKAATYAYLEGNIAKLIALVKQDNMEIVISHIQHPSLHKFMPNKLMAKHSIARMAA